jgi:outer membrane protein assembly factor BamB
MSRVIAGCLIVGFLAGCTKQTPVNEVVPSGKVVEELPPPQLAADDWPWWRGPTRNGVAAEQTPPTTWSDGENVVWKVEVPGRGHSSPTVVGNRIYLATADDAAGAQSVLALDRATGAMVWQTQLNQGGFPTAMHKNSTHANGTVACDGERLVIAFLHHDEIWAYGLDLEGNELWQQKLGAFVSTFGYAPSPLIHKSAAIIAADNSGGSYLAAVHRETGEVIWRKSRPTTSTYSSPTVANVGGRERLLISGASLIHSYDPDTGDEQWNTAGPSSATCGTMVWDGDIAIASGGYPEAGTFGVNASTGAKLWGNGEKCYEQSLLAHAGHVYSTTNNGAFCWSASDGQEKWRGRLGGSSAIAGAGRRSHLCEQRGGNDVRPSRDAGTIRDRRREPVG